MGWTVFWMAVVLKIPVIGALWIVWWAIREEPAPAGEPEHGDGGTRVDRHRHPRPRPPRPPRRGPHAEPPPVSPRRVRVAGKRLTPSHD